MASSAEVASREKILLDDAVKMIKAVELLIPDTYSPFGLYTMLSSGVFALPWLTSCREEFQAANIGTRLVNGGMHAIDPEGSPLSVEARIEMVRANLAKTSGGGGVYGI
jgi:thiazole synthase ThiGH ThiG subunit